MLRQDAHGNLLAVARVIGWSADKRTGRSRPTISRIMAATGLSKRCVQKWCRWLEDHGWLEVLEPGVTPLYRPALQALEDPGNLAREWLLTIPGDVSCTPPQDPDLDQDPRSGVDLDFDPGDLTPTRARTRASATGNTQTQMDRRSAADCPSAPPPPRLPPWPPGQNPQRRRDQLAAADQLRADLPVLRALTTEAVRSAVREYFAAGWTVADVEHALDHHPGGTAHACTDVIRHPRCWLAWRLGLWRAADGGVLPSHSAQLRARAARHRAELTRQRQHLAPAPRAVTDQARRAERQACGQTPTLRDILAARPRPASDPVSRHRASG